MFYTAKNTFCYSEGLAGFLFVVLLVVVECFVGVLCVYFFLNFGLFETPSGWDYMGGGSGGGCCSFSWLT